MKIIGLLGKAGSGKSTAARYLEERYGAKVFSLAAPLKRMAKDILGFSDAQLYGTQADKEAIDPRYGFSSRWFLQKLATEGCRRHLGEDVWVKAVFRSIYTAPYPKLAVIEDVRFVNECKELYEDPAGHVVKLVCADAPDASNADHPSEAEVDQVPEEYIAATISSHRTPDSIDLKEKLTMLMEYKFDMPVRS